MKALYENANEGHQVTEAFHELIKLELSEWIPVIIIVLHRLAGIEHIMDDYSDTPLRRLETFPVTWSPPEYWDRSSTRPMAGQ